MRKVLFFLLPIVLVQIGCAMHIPSSDSEIQTFEKKWIYKPIDTFLNQDGGEMQRWARPYSLENGNTLYEYYYLSQLKCKREKPSLLKHGIYYFAMKGMSVHACYSGPEIVRDISKFLSLYVNQENKIYRIEHKTGEFSRYW